MDRDLTEAGFMPEDLWLAYKHYIGGIGEGEHQKEERVRFFILILKILATMSCMYNHMIRP